MNQDQGRYNVKELSIEDYQEYFVLDETTGNLFVRTDLKKKMKELKGNKIWLLLKIMFSGSADAADIEAFEYGKGFYARTRGEFNGMRDALFSALSARDGAYCKHCKTVEDLTIDHIIAVARGGKNVMSNFQILCRSCNSRKGAR